MRSLRTTCVRRADPRPRPPAHTCRPLPQRCKRDTSLRPRLSSSPRPGHVSFRPQVPVSCIPVCDTPGCDCPSRLSGKGTYHRPPGPPPGPVRAPRGRCVSRPVDGAARQRGGVWDGRAGPRPLRVPEGRRSRPWEAAQRPVRLRVCSAVISHQPPLPPGAGASGQGARPAPPAVCPVAAPSFPFLQHGVSAAGPRAPSGAGTAARPSTVVPASARSSFCPHGGHHSFLAGGPSSVLCDAGPGPPHGSPEL